MENRKTIIFTAIAIILGFMLAVQFKSTQEPVFKDTRDIWQLREALIKEKELQSDLMDEIRSVDDILYSYETDQNNSKIDALKQQKEQLKARIGLNEKIGDGIIITIEKLYNDSFGGYSYDSIPPLLLSRLINELNKFKVEAIAVADERIISITPIRDVNGQTYVNNSPLPPLPIEIKVIAKDAKKLHNRMVISQINDEFAIENLQITSKFSENIFLPAYDEPIRIRDMEAVEGDS